MEIIKEKTFELLQRKYLLFSVLFLFVIVVGYTPVYLSGKSLIWNIDGIGQYYPAFLYIGQYLRNALAGGGIPSYDLSIAMGENIVGCLNYYGFGDPISLLAIFATEDNGYIIFAVTYFIRVCLAGFAMIYYLDTIKRGKARQSNCCFSLLLYRIHIIRRHILYRMAICFNIIAIDVSRSRTLYN